MTDLPAGLPLYLADGIVQSADLDGTVLDVGSGIGGLTFALLERGATGAVAVDASRSFVEAARVEAIQRGHADAVRFFHADFVEAASQIPRASIVTAGSCRLLLSIV